MPEQPNLVFLFPDQLRADFLGCYGAAFLDTPHIDRLSEQGVLYRNGYSPHPICVPARVALLTGMDAIQNGVLDNGQFLRPDHAELGIRTWPGALADAGYYTAAIGKMHFYPWDLRLGFQYRASAEDKRWIYIRDDYYHFLRDHGYRKLHGNEHPGYYKHKGAIVNRIPWEYSIDHFVGQEACRFIERYGAEGPFAMMVGFPGPHCPYDPSPEFLDQVAPEAMPAAVPEVEGDTPLLRQQNVDGNKRPWNGVDYTEFSTEDKRRIRRHYAALVAQIDHEVGQILAALERHGLLENTVIVFASDHGDYLGDHNLIGKGTFYESSIHVPLLVHIPWLESAQVCDDLVSLTDVHATLLGFAGLQAPVHADTRALPRLGLGPASPRGQIVGITRGGWMIDDGEWRLAKYATGEHLLFHLAEDPLEQRNLYSDPQYLDTRDRLERALTSALMRSIGEANHDRRVYAKDLSQQTWFGREGWQRPYPRRIDDR
jgi:arylsulfatase